MDDKFLKITTFRVTLPLMPSGAVSEGAGGMESNTNEELILLKELEDTLATSVSMCSMNTTEDMTRPSTGMTTCDYVEADASNKSDDEEYEFLANGVVDKKQRQSKAKKYKKKKRRKKFKKLRKQAEAERHLVGDTEAEEQQNVKDGKAEAMDTTPATDGSVDKNKYKKEISKRNTKDDKKEEEEEVAAVNEDVTVEYVPERITIADLTPMYRQFSRVFDNFKMENKQKLLDKEERIGDSHKNLEKVGYKLFAAEDQEMKMGQKDDREKLSKRKLKKLTRLSVVELKQLVSRPDVVEKHDVTARDPKLLVHLKAYRNTVQIPRHWCFKRKYLQGKRGIEKPPFDLPSFIEKTGICEMRESLQEQDDAKSLKSKIRERVRLKMGKLDIDYQKLHDAFFEWQTKPHMTIHGDLYYEGKEFEPRLKEMKPGDLSEELHIALGMLVSPNSHKIPPPWLIAQQRYGPPPSYTNLKIPGLNAPIPNGSSFGYHAGGWGKPPVDDTGKSLYGDVFGTNITSYESALDEDNIKQDLWGELKSASKESEEENDSDGTINVYDDGLVTPSGLTSLPAVMEAPESIKLRKKKIEQKMDDNETYVLYQVLPEKRGNHIAGSMMGSTGVYDFDTLGKPAASRETGGLVAERKDIIELALDPSELNLYNDAMGQRYEQQMQQQENHLHKGDFSDMLAEHVARQKWKRKRQQPIFTIATASTSSEKKYKEFQF